MMSGYHVSFVIEHVYYVVLYVHMHYEYACLHGLQMHRHKDSIAVVSLRSARARVVYTCFVRGMVCRI